MSRVIVIHQDGDKEHRFTIQQEFVGCLLNAALAAAPAFLAALMDCLSQPDNGQAPAGHNPGNRSRC